MDAGKNRNFKYGLKKVVSLFRILEMKIIVGDKVLKVA